MADRQGDQELGDWDISRDAPYFGIPIPGCARQVLLCVARRADRLSRLAQELLRQRQGARATASRAASRSSSLRRDVEQIHFIGKDIIYFHTLFWPAMLNFAGRKVPDHVYVHGFITVVRREDVEVARHGHQPAALSRARHESGVAALLHRRQAERERRGHRLQSRRLHRARQQRPGRQVRQHREPHGGLHHQALRRQDSAASIRSAPLRLHSGARSRSPPPTAFATTTTRANSARRCAKSWSSPTA